MKQITSKVLMISPTNFGFNEEAFKTNKFQERPLTDEENALQEVALKEFNLFVRQLLELNVDVRVVQDLTPSHTPDSLFPNNWISTHASGKIITYPMAVANRRAERRSDIVAKLIEEFGYSRLDFTSFENDGKFLEGTGSMIFDHDHRLVFAALSPRTNEEVLNAVAAELGYSTVPFISYGKTGELIYHTNVMMAIGDRYICIGMDTIDAKDHERVSSIISRTGKEIILLTNEQVYDHFAGNMLQIMNASGETILVLSQKAFDSLSTHQLERLQALNDHLLPISIPTIERIGGGSVRCMLAEVFTPVG